MSNVKKFVVDYCRFSGCPVQESFDQHIAQNGSLMELKLIKDAHCVRCDVYKLRKWLESQDLDISPIKGTKFTAM